MGLFGNDKVKRLQAKVLGMDLTIKTSFGRVREDMHAAYAWISYFQQQNSSLQQEVQRLSTVGETVQESVRNHQKFMESSAGEVAALKKEFHLLPKQVELLARQVERTLTEDKLDFYLARMSKEILHVDRKLEALAYLPTTMEGLKDQLEDHIATPHHTSAVEKRMAEMEGRLQNLVVKRSPKDKLVQKVTKQTHDYLKAMILSYVRKYEKISAFQLREMVVEEQNLTSKSTFYRIMEEIEQEEGVGIVRSGKEKIYLYKPQKTV
ncbi:MAG: hypothetical protein Q7S65_02190 [Nanoarchaeota archaeon]|nr:hypothetical protein [Nanoarchaeota archaeon]